MQPDKIMVGVVAKPQGIRGEVKVMPAADEPELFCELDRVFVKSGEDYVSYPIEASRVNGGIVYLFLEGVDSRDKAEAIRDAELYALRSEMPPCEEGRVYICDLIGCKAVGESGRELGTLTDVIQNGAADIYVFKDEKGSFMAPALKDAFTGFDIAERRINVCEARLGEVSVRED
ncbi:MAG: ribosome maturation factor RimM [Eubacteriales bacterium]|nr:ribosome maturation factor RimM [Eubacteriales bacterium]MDD3882948.1 ribosome maturation factor RimM [Eubacteriales bacterium]MDD4513505.1 ribosome maturation factor RimM [Eubacteriales bacterium]